MTTYLLGAIVRLWGRLAKGGIDKWERGRARSIAAASAPLHGDVIKPEDRPLVEGHHEIVVEYRTGELPKVRDERRPSVRDIARKYGRKPKHARHRVPRAKRFDPLTSPLRMPLEKPVMVPGVIPTGPLDDFTGEWNAGSTFVRRLNGAKAANAR